MVITSSSLHALPWLRKPYVFYFLFTQLRVRSALIRSVQLTVFVVMTCVVACLCSEQLMNCPQWNQYSCLNLNLQMREK